MTQNGLFTKEEAHQLLDFPDLEQANKLKTAHIEIIDMMIEKMVDKGEYISPEPYMNLEYGIIRVQQAYNLSMIENVPEDRLELLRRWISQASSLIEASQPPAPPAMAAPPMAPPMPPGAPAPGAPAMPPGLPPGPPGLM